MNLRYIVIGLEYNTYIHNNKLRYQFKKHTRFISNYFSKAIRKYKYKTDGTFNMISVDLDPIKIETCKIVPFEVLKVDIPFNKAQYEAIQGTSDCNYYLELLEQGFVKAFKFKSIPLDILMNLIKEFKIGGCTNKWLHKKRQSKVQDLGITLTCEFTTNHFQLVAEIEQLSTNKTLVTGVVLKTEADEVIFEGMFKDIIIDKDIVITDITDSPRVIINKDAVFNGKLEYEIIGNEEMKKMLSYNL